MVEEKPRPSPGFFQTLCTISEEAGMSVVTTMNSPVPNRTTFHGKQMKTKSYSHMCALLS